jgi:hypothetical protein
MDEEILLFNGERVQRHEPFIIESVNSDRCINWKERSDAAYLAGFLAIAAIFSRFSIAPLIWQMFRLWQHQPGTFDLNRPSEALAATLFTLAIPLPGLPALFALWFSIKGCSDLKRNSHKTGMVQALVALFIGAVGTVILLSEIVQVAITLLS